MRRRRGDQLETAWVEITGMIENNKFYTLFWVVITKSLLILKSLLNQIPSICTFNLRELYPNKILEQKWKIIRQNYLNSELLFTISILCFSTCYCKDHHMMVRIMWHDFLNYSPIWIFRILITQSCFSSNENTLEYFILFVVQSFLTQRHSFFHLT